MLFPLLEYVFLKKLYRIIAFSCNFMKALIIKKGSLMPETNKIALITADDLKQMIEANPEIIIINVLDEKFYQDCHIKGSINIPFERLLEKTSSWDKDKDVVVYCATASCPKSKKAYALMQDLGFFNLHEYAGGMQEWFQAGYDTSGACILDYIHQKE